MDDNQTQSMKKAHLSSHLTDLSISVVLKSFDCLRRRMRRYLQRLKSLFMPCFARSGNQDVFDRDRSICPLDSGLQPKETLQLGISKCGRESF